MQTLIPMLGRRQSCRENSDKIIDSAGLRPAGSVMNIEVSRNSGLKVLV
jgi:hypothetical protein